MAGINIVQMEDAIKGLPDDMLMQQAREPTGQYPQFLLISEIQRRANMRESYAAQLQQEQGTVSDQIIQRGVGGAGPMLPEGGQSMNGAAPQGVGGAGPMFPQMGQPMNGAGSPSLIEQQIQMLLANGVPINDIAGAVGSQNPNQNAVNQGPSFPPQRMAAGRTVRTMDEGQFSEEFPASYGASRGVSQSDLLGSKIFGREGFLDPTNPVDYLMALTGAGAGWKLARHGFMKHGGPQAWKAGKERLGEGIAALKQWRKAAGDPVKRRVEEAAGRRAFKEAEKGAAKTDPWKQYDRVPPPQTPRSAKNIPVVRRKLDDLPWPPPAQSLRELGAPRVGEYYGRWMKPGNPDFWLKGTGAAAGGAGTTAAYLSGYNPLQHFEGTNEPTEAERNATENPNILDSSSMRTTDDKGQSTDQVNNALTEDGSKADIPDELQDRWTVEQMLHGNVMDLLNEYRGGGPVRYMQNGGLTPRDPYTFDQFQFLKENPRYSGMPDWRSQVPSWRQENPENLFNKVWPSGPGGTTEDIDPFKATTAMLPKIVTESMEKWQPTSQTDELLKGLDLSGTDIDYSQFAPDYGLFITEERKRAKKVKEDSMKEARWRTLVQLGAGIAGGSLAEGLSAAGKEAVAAKREGREEAREAEALARRLELEQEKSRGQIGLAGAQAKQARQIAEEESKWNAKVKIAELSEGWNIARLKNAISGITTMVNSEYYNYLKSKGAMDFKESQYEAVDAQTLLFAEALLKEDPSHVQDEARIDAFMKQIMKFQQKMLINMSGEPTSSSGSDTPMLTYDPATGTFHKL